MQLLDSEAPSPRIQAFILAATALASAALAAAPPTAWLAATWLGGSPAYMALAPLLFHLLGGRRGAALVAAIALSAGAASALKHLLGLPRPPQELWLAEAEGPGFPSAHAAVAAAFWLALALTAPSPATVALAAAVPALVAGSRLALRVHYPIDAAGGALMGAALGAAAAAAARLEPHTLLAISGLAGLAVQAPAGLPEPEAPLVAIGAAAAAWLYRGRLEARRLHEAAAASLAALTVGGLALAAPGPAGHALMVVAGAAAVAAPQALQAARSRLKRRVPGPAGLIRPFK